MQSITLYNQRSVVVYGFIYPLSSFLFKMAQQILLILALSVFNCEVLSQIIRPPLGQINGPLSELIESPCQYTQRIPESPMFEYITQLLEANNNIIPISNPSLNIPKNPINSNYRKNVINIPNTPSTTLITDCSPSVCKNLASTVQLLIVSNLLDAKKGGDEIAVQMAGPLMKELLTAPMRYGAPNSIPYLRSAVSSLSGASPSVISPSLVSPAVISSKLSGTSPKVVLDNNGVASNGQIDRALLTGLLQLLGGGVQL